MRNEKRRLLSGIEIGTLACSAMAIAFGLAYAGAQPHMLGSLFGLAPDQTVRLSVSNIGNPGLRDGLPPGPCLVQLKIFGADGSVVQQSEFLKIMPGASVSRDLKFEELLSRAPKSLNFGTIDNTNRVQLRASSFIVGPDSTAITDGTSSKVTDCPASQFKFFKLSTEVFDNVTGRTTFMVPADSALPAVQ